MEITILTNPGVVRIPVASTDSTPMHTIVVAEGERLTFDLFFGPGVEECEWTIVQSVGDSVGALFASGMVVVKDKIRRVPITLTEPGTYEFRAVVGDYTWDNITAGESNLVTLIPVEQEMVKFYNDASEHKLTVAVDDATHAIDIYVESTDNMVIWAQNDLDPGVNLYYRIVDVNDKIRRIPMSFPLAGSYTIGAGVFPVNVG